MSITTTSYTTNCKKVAVSDELSIINIIDGVNTAITALGWDFYDERITALHEMAATSSGTTVAVADTSNIEINDALKYVSGTGSITEFTRVVSVTNSTHVVIDTAPALDLNSATIAFLHGNNDNTTKVYRKINADGSTYKYAILRWSTVNLDLNISTCESYDVNTKTITNESWNNSGAFAHGVDIKDMFFLVSATDRHLMIWSYLRNEPGIWSGIFEFERVVPEDTGSIPCWAYTNSLMLGTPWGQGLSTTPSRVMFAFPRTADNQTGSAAARVYAPVTNRGMYPPAHPVANVAITIDTNLLHLGSYANITYGWDATKSIASAVAADAIDKSMPIGRIYDVGITKSLGGVGDSTFVNANSTGGWPEASGSSTEFLLMPLNGGSESDTAWGTGKLANTQIILPTGAVTGSIVSIGNNIWFGATDGIRTASMATGNAGGSTLQWTSVAGPVIDIKFDGRRTIYGSTNAGIVALDTETKAVKTINLPDGGGNISMDNMFVYVSNRFANTRPPLYVIARSSDTYVTQGSALYIQNNASSVGTQVIVPSTAGIFVGGTPLVTGGTGAFAGGTTVTSINSNVSFTVSATPSTQLNGANVQITNFTALATVYGDPRPDGQGNIYVATQAATATASQTMRVGSFTMAPNYVGPASSSGTIVTVDDTAGVIRGARITKLSGTGTLADNTLVDNILSNRTFSLNVAPAVDLQGATLLVDLPLSGCNSTSTVVSITNANAAGLIVGARLRILSGTGTLAANTVITRVVNATAFTVNTAPTLALSNAELVAEPLLTNLHFVNPKRTGAADHRAAPTSWFIDKLSGPSPRLYLLVCDTTAGTIYEYNSLGIQLQAVNFTTNATAANLYSNRMASTAFADYMNDLFCIPFRGVYLVGVKRPGGVTLGGFTSRIVFDHPQGTAIGGINATNVNNTIRTDGSPLGYSNILWSDRNKLYSSFSITVSDHRLYHISGLFNTTPYNTSITGRLLIKA